MDRGRALFLLFAVLVTLAAALACGESPSPGPAPSVIASGVASADAAPTAGPKSPPRAPLATLDARGSAVALTPDGETLVVADEDHEVLFVTPASLGDPGRARVVALPGPPAQVVAMEGLVLVTIRTLPTDESRAARDVVRGRAPAASDIGKEGDEPMQARLDQAMPPFDPAVVRKSQGGLLVAMKPDADRGLVEIGRVVLAPDAWGLAVDPRSMRVVVTSAWSAEVAVVDASNAAALTVVARLATAREPRGVAITPDGKTAFVSHLVGSALTRIDDLEGAPRATSAPLRAAPERGPAGHEAAASLGYALVLSPDGSTLFAPRHALGAEGTAAWWGAPTVDVMDASSGASLQPTRESDEPSSSLDYAAVDARPPDAFGAFAGLAPRADPDLVQPRAIVYRKRTHSLFVASEGASKVVELDADAASPAMARLAVLDLYAPSAVFVPVSGGAPSGLALSQDEDTLFVFCRTTYDVVRFDLTTRKSTRLRLAKDPLPLAGAFGRRLFADSNAVWLSGGLGCAACHPEGRDDGYTWRETEGRFVGLRENVRERTYDGSSVAPPGAGVPGVKLYARQTPMLAGRVRASGPYGWHGESKDLRARLMEGTKLHRSLASDARTDSEITTTDAIMIAAYLRAGLLPPPTRDRPLTDQEAAGKRIFEGSTASCTHCHDGTELSNRSIADLPAFPSTPDFDAEPDTHFKTPSLWFVGGTAPYFHDGSAPTLASLIGDNGTRMGNTATLSPADKAALVAYLETL